MAQPELSPLDRQLCAETTTGFFVNLDRGRYDRVVALMARDGQWVRRGQALIGHAEILAALEARKPGLVSRHVVGDIAVTALGPDTAEVYFTVLAFQHDPQGQAAGPPRIAGPEALLTSVDRLVRVGDGWKIAHKESQLTFLIGAPASGPG